MAPVIKELDKYPGEIVSATCATAQHRGMLDQVLNLFHIDPDYDLDLMRESQTLSALTSRVFDALDPVLAAEAPDWILVQGDTTTVMAASIAAYYQRVKVGHVEAGLRTHNKWHPFPEEINRRVTGVVADLHFAPTEVAQDNLIEEGVKPTEIYVTGNPVIDAVQAVARMPYEFEAGPLSEIPWNKKIILVTALRNICMAIRSLAMEYNRDVHFVYPVHPNPNVKGAVMNHLNNVDNISLIEPLNYLAFVHLLQRSYLVMTDSGGIQEEAPAFGKPVIVLRNTTERPEGITAGTAQLAGTNYDEILRLTSSLLENAHEYEKMARTVNPFGDGRSSKRIVKTLIDYQL